MRENYEAGLAPIIGTLDRFTTKLYKAVKKRPGNNVLDPMCVHLSMVIMALFAGGQTRTKITEVLTFLATSFFLTRSFHHYQSLSPIGAEHS